MDALFSLCPGGRTALLSSNARDDGYVDEQQWEEYSKFVYMRWYNHYKNMTEGDIDKLVQPYNKPSFNEDGTIKDTAEQRMARYRSYIDNIRNNPKYKPKNITTYYEFLSHECRKEDLSDFGAYYNQNSNFFHILPLQTQKGKDDTQFRLYLNISSKYITEVAKGLMQKCDQQNLPLYFKTSDNTEYADTIIIYTSYRHAQPIVEILKQLKQERPEIFVGAEKTAKSEGQIAGFIGCGEEPDKKFLGGERSSYNEERGKVVESLKGDFIIKNAKQVITPNFAGSSFMQNLMHELQGIITQNKDFQEKNLDVDFTSEDNVARMRSFAIRTLRAIIDGNEGEKTYCKIVDKKKEKRTISNMQFDITPKLLDVFGCNKSKDPQVNKDELLEYLFKDKKGGGYSAFCFQALKQTVIDEANERISEAKNGFVRGLMNGSVYHQIPVSTYQSIIKAVEQGTAKGNRLVNKGVYNHILDLWEGNAEMNDHNRDPQKHKKPTSIGACAKINFSRNSHIQSISDFGFATKMISEYMQQQGIKPILPNDSQIREECKKRNISFDNFCLNENSMVNYREWEKKQLNNN